ncbi:MAG: group II intron maturase-specific domain-containing protein, partial [Planctomycetota bacterium]
LRGWANYFSRYYPSLFVREISSVNALLVAWARRKYRRLSIPAMPNTHSAASRTAIPVHAEHLVR